MLHHVNETLLRASAQITRDLQPSMHVAYAGHGVVGEYPMHEDGFVARLAALDRGRLEAFVASCDGLVASGLVTQLKDVCLIQDVPIGPGPPTPFRAHAMPCSTGRVQISSQFSRGIDVARNGRSFVTTLRCDGRVPLVIAYTGNQIGSRR